MTNVSLEEPRALVQQLVTKFLPDNDSLSIQNVSSSFNQLLLLRQKKMTQSRETLQLWIKKVEAAKWEAARPADKSEVKHTERMNEAERERFMLVKQIDELELASQKFFAIFEEATDEMARLKSSNEVNKKLVIKPIELHLELYKSLGVEWLHSNVPGSENSSAKKCRIRSAMNNDVHILEIDSQASAFEVCNQLWRLCSY